ncbi:hypothetical protein ACQW02_14345 [Humitalea sp. 24SJ18S-53]|uniref:hypothetical protein n=1 Tax=Humitalea sp. 24SJ18S-53 TaxID=3422307 RepID=UPI003D664178
MESMWSVIGVVSSGLTLAAFMVAVAAWVYKSRLDHRERILKTTPPDKRGAAALEILEASRIDPGNLSQSQRFDIARRELEMKAARFRTTAIIISFIGVLGFALAIYAIGRTSPGAPTVPAASAAPPRPPSAADARLAAAFPGTWKSQGKLPRGTGWHVEDLQYTAARNGMIEWRGTFNFGGARYPILMSGDWRIEDSTLLYTIQQSNVSAIPSGYRGATPLVSISDTEVRYRDPGNNGALSADPRLP